MNENKNAVDIEKGKQNSEILRDHENLHQKSKAWTHKQKIQRERKTILFSNQSEPYAGRWLAVCWGSFESWFAWADLLLRACARVSPRWHISDLLNNLVFWKLLRWRKQDVTSLSHLLCDAKEQEDCLCFHDIQFSTVTKFMSKQYIFISTKLIGRTGKILYIVQLFNSW